MKVLIRYVCSWCGRLIREEVGELPEELVAAGLTTSHSMCAECLEAEQGQIRF